MTKPQQQVAAFAFGVVFIVTMLTLAITVPDPTDFQYMVFRIVLALATAGIAAMIPGFLHVELPGWLRAGGALAVFVIVYFYNPASLVRRDTDGHNQITTPPHNSVTTSAALEDSHTGRGSTKTTTASDTASPPRDRHQVPEKWQTTIKAHGTPQENPSGWLDGRYTAYIKDEPYGAVTSDPVSAASHVGYVVDVPRKGAYIVTVAYTASGDYAIDVFTAPDVPHENGIDIFGARKAQVPFPPTPSPVMPQVARLPVLDLEAGRNVIDLRPASSAGLPKLFSIMVRAVDDL